MARNSAGRCRRWSRWVPRCSARHASRFREVNRTRRPLFEGAAMSFMKMHAEPYEFEFDPRATALIVIDMQRDFVEPGGFGEALGNDVTPLQAIVPTVAALLDWCRAREVTVIHTREGHRPDLTDCPPAKLRRGDPATRIDA